MKNDVINEKLEHLQISVAQTNKSNQTSFLAQEKIMVMAGHDEGIITFGKNLEEAGAVLLKYLSWFLGTTQLKPH